MCCYDEEIEQVTVNGMQMFKWGNQLFLTKKDAVSEIVKSKRNNRALEYGYTEEDHEPLEEVIRNGVLHAIRIG